jgi:hypothetical protein
MDDNINNIRNEIGFVFADHFIIENVFQDQLSFARHYAENIMRIDISPDSTIRLAPITATVLVDFLASIALAYEDYNKEKSEDGSPLDEM